MHKKAYREDLDDRIHILVVEDEQAHSELIRRTFEFQATQVSLTFARNLAEAYAILAETNPDLAIIDLVLPDGKGIKLLPGEKEKSPYPFVIMTSHGNEEVAVEAIKMGALDYVVKSEETLNNMPQTAARALREWGHIAKRKQAEEDLKISHQQLRDLYLHLQSVREEERLRISREIHDELGQILTALKLELFWLAKRISKKQKIILEKINSMSEMIDSTIKSVQKISTALRPGILDDLGLVAAMQWQADEFQNRTDITCHIDVEPEEFVLDTDRTTTIFRIFQETLTNVMRHAKATRVDAKLIKKNNTILLRVNDNGVGISNKDITDSKSLGLIGIRERVNAWGGRVNVAGSAEEGTIVSITIPIDNQQ